MKKTPKDESNIYILTEENMQKIEELIAEIQAFYCEIYSNRSLSLSSCSEPYLASTLINAVVENKTDLEKFIDE